MSNQGSDQPAHPCSLAKAFAAHKVEMSMKIKYLITGYVSIILPRLRFCAIWHIKFPNVPCLYFKDKEHLFPVLKFL